MTKILILLLLSSQFALAQQTHAFIIHIVNDDTHQAVTGASVTIAELRIGNISDSLGNTTLPKMPDGKYDVGISCLGYNNKELSVVIPQPSLDTLFVSLEPSEEEASQQVVVSSTRLNESVANSPVHIDVIGKEDIEEGTAESPGNIRELLTELSGTQIQQTSPVSGNVTIRLEGLDGRYTQLLKDGFPLYGGFSGSLNILQTPPLDLRQVEIIKGAGSALYGGDAIGGIINLISKTPDTTMHADAIFNQTMKGGADLSGFYSKRNRKVGLTLLATTSRQTPWDVNHDGFTDIPKVRQLTINPTLFWYPDDSTTLRLDVNISTENRAGGDILAIKNGIDSCHSFLQNSHTDRDYYQFSFMRRLPNRTTFSLKNTAGYFYRSMLGDGKVFSGVQLSSFTEASLVVKHTAHQDVLGMNYITDKFISHEASTPVPFNYTNNTFGLFLQDDWRLSEKATMETGLRTDLHHQLFVLPRVAFIYKLMPKLTLRAAAGTGYKLPTIFNATSEEQGYNSIYPINSSVKAERSSSANFAVNYLGNIGDDIHFKVDQNFYYTRLSNALIPNDDSLAGGWLYYINAPRSIISKGFETNATVSLEDVSLNLSYTYTDARKDYLQGNPQLPLTPRNKFVSSIVYEQEDNFQAGIEAFYTGHQYLDAGTQTPNFWTFDCMVEKTFRHFSILLNIENFTDTRQSKYGSLYTGTLQHPVFNEIFAPLEGIVGNLSLKFKW